MTDDNLATADPGRNTADIVALRRWLREKDDEVAIFKRTLDKRDAEIERLRDHVKFLNSFRPDAELAKRDAEIERLREVLEFVLEAASWHFDGDADPLNESPEDMTAHINGLIVKRVREALED